MSKVSTCLWFGNDAEAAVRFYVSLVPGSSLTHILRSPGSWPGGAAGDVIMVTFTLGGYLTLAGGFEKWATLADGVFASQVARLQKFVNASKS